MDDNILVLNDENGNEVKFEFLDLITYRNNEYVVLLPAENGANEVTILQIEDADEDTENYISVENDYTLQAVFELFKERAKDTFEFID